MSSSSLCGRCALTFSIFKRKYRCIVCHLLFCTPCFKKGLNFPERNAKHCLKCHAFSSRPNFKQAELMLLSIKELKEFLLHNNVPMTGCKEKRDLVDVIMNHQRPAEPLSDSSLTSQSSSSSQSQHGPTSSISHGDHDQPTSASSNHSDSATLSEDIRSFVDRVLTGYPGMPVSTTSNSSNSSSSHTVYVLNDDGVQQVETEEHVPTIENQNQDDSSPKPEPPKNCEDSSKIKKLSVKELKAVLDKNFVDYKGCCEKDELIHRVSMLWQAKESEDNAAPDETDDNTSGDSDMCKVCMDKMVNCVLLECGHMMTCVECGRKLQECPMCRQNISRIVRVFKS